MNRRGEFPFEIRFTHESVATNDGYVHRENHAVGLVDISFDERCGSRCALGFNEDFVT